MGSPEIKSSYMDPLRENLAGSDLLLSAFVAANMHYKRATVALPFPSEIFSTNSKEKDYEAAQKAIDSLPPMQALLEASGSGGPCDPAAGPASQLLDWLLAPSGRRGPRMHHISMPELNRQLLRSHGASPNLDPPHGQAPPTYIFQSLAPAASFENPLLAFHGTSFERLHSILSTGLQPASGTRLQRNGAIHGEGIYLTSNYGVAFSFCNSAPAWKRSALGCKLRAMLVCQVEARHASRMGTAAEAAPGSRLTADDLPQHYLLVQRPDAIRISHVLVFCDERSHAALPATRHNEGGGASWLPKMDLAKAIILGYAVWMLVQYLMQNRQFKRWLGQYY